MGKVSILIPSRNEIFLTKTIKDVLEKSRGEIEVIVNVDENWPDEIIKDDRVIYLHPDTPKGMRAGINACVEKSTGEFLLKTDGHCMFQEGFDVLLQETMQDNWIVIPRRNSLDPENWVIDWSNKKPPRDYHYLCMPDPRKGNDKGIHGQEWPEMGRLHSMYSIDDTPSFQGSCWFMKKGWFTDFLGGMSEYGYGTFSQEPQEIGMKTWLGGGEIKVNKNVWYAHLHKGKKYGRMYRIGASEVVDGHNYSAWFWVTNQWENRIHDFKWFVEKFLPMPTWTEDWEKVLYDFWPNFIPVIQKGN